MKNRKKISVIVPVYNEALNIEDFYPAIEDACESLKRYDYEIIYVNDGSADDTKGVLDNMVERHPNVQAVNFSRNFGKEAATSAGLHIATGDAAIIVDGDGQHPINLLSEFVAKWEAGNDVVVGVRTSNQKEGFIKKYGSHLFYATLRGMGVKDVVPGTTDFRLIDRRVINEFKRLNEKDRVTRALVDWLGYKKDYIEFVANARTKGEASYSTRKLIRLAINGFVSASFTPLFLSGYLGVFITLASLVAGVFIGIENYLLGDPLSIHVTGTAALAILIIFLVGILLIGQGLLAIYVAHIYNESKDRPLYIVESHLGKN